MVKRKIEINLDKWLEQGAIVDESKSTKAAEAPVEQPRNQSTNLAEVGTEARAKQSAVAEPVVEPLQLEGDRSKVAEVESEAHEWFWLLLDQSGYERW